jgi:hypothetical protein
MVLRKTNRVCLPCTDCTGVPFVATGPHGLRIGSCPGDERGVPAVVGSGRLSEPRRLKGLAMKRLVIALVAALLAVLGFTASPAFAQSGHFIENGAGAPSCTEIGTQVQCAGKVAGLGGTTFEITIEAAGIASVECTNPGGNVAPGQDTAVTVSGTTGPLPTPRNGQFEFSITTDPPPQPPPTPTCPNDMWTAEIVDVTFTTATLTLLEDGAQSDQVVVPVS